MKDIYIETDRLLTDSDYMEQPNLLKNSDGVTFQPTKVWANYDVYQIYDSVTVDMVHGHSYVLSAESNGELSGYHDNTSESNRAVIWLTNDSRSTIISDSNTSTGTRFVWNYETGTYKLRVNAYKKDGSTKVWNVKLQSCDNKIATDQNIAEINTTIQSLKDRISKLGGVVLATIRSISRLYIVFFAKEAM